MATLSDTHHWTDRLILHESARPQRRKCRVCSQLYERPRDMDYTLCPHCLEDPDRLLEHIDAMLKSTQTEVGLAMTAWVDRQARIPDPLGARWAALVAARSNAQSVVTRLKTGGRRARVVVEAKAVQEAERALAGILAKIERTRDEVPDLAILLYEEAAHERRIQALWEQRCRWEMARSDLEVATGTEFN